MNKKYKIIELTNKMLNEAVPHMRKQIERAVNSGAIDTDEWDENSSPMILPKAVLIAVMENEADQYKATGTSFEKQVKSEVKNIKYFL